MVEVIKPLVKVVGYGPYLDLGEGKVMTPDEIVWAAASATYKGPRAVEEFYKLKQEGGNEEELQRKITSSLIKSAGAGHASLATTPGIWFFLGGACSKLEGSIFTSAKFTSAIMPSSRRVPIAIENILIPKGIAEMGGKAVEIYLSASEANIRAYEELQKKGGVSREDAAKIVQYGHWGGGLMFMPLETLIYFAKEIENDKDCIPQEAKESISQLESFIHSHGMGVTYEGRKAAPRTGCPNPNIFQDRISFAQELTGREFNSEPFIVSESYIPSAERDSRIAKYLEKRAQVFSDKSAIQEQSPSLLRELELIIADYNDSARVTMAANISWRVWRELKRHRTLPQTVESVYHTVERATNVLAGGDEFLLDDVVVFPPSVLKNPDNYKLWTNRFSDSIAAYQILVDMGAKRSDAIAVVPSGIKVGVEKTYDFYNLTTGFGSLRLCSEAEPEMKEMAEAERKLILNSDAPGSIKSLLVPKCNYVGYCSETKHCGNIRKVVKDYDNEMHADIKARREDGIRARLNSYKGN